MALSFRKFIKGIRVVPESSSSVNEKGDLDVTSGDGKLNYYNGTSSSPVVTEAHSATFTNKTFDAEGTGNSLSNIKDSNIKVGAAISRAKLASGTANRVITNDASGVLSELTLSSAQIILGNASSVPTATSVTGEVTIDSNGITTVGTVANSVISGFLRTEMEVLVAALTISPSKSFVRLTSGSSSIQAIAAGLDGQHLVLLNTSGASLIIKNQFASGSSDIITGTGGDISLENNASLFLIYNSTAPNPRWYVIGGVGGSSSINFSASNAAVVAGDAVYYDGTTIQRLDASNDSKVEFIGVALDNGGGAIRIQVSGKIETSDSGFTVGKPVFADPNNPGKYVATAPSTAGQWVIPVGIAVSGTAIAINGAGSSTAVKLTSEADPYVYAAVRAVSTTQTLLGGDSIVLATGGAGGITLTLPGPVSGKIYNIKKVDAGVGAITINTSSGTIDGAASKTLTTQYQSLTLASDGTNFFIL